MSRYALGKTKRPVRGEDDFLPTGISVFDDRDAAASHSTRTPTWAAELELEDRPGIVVTKTGSIHHFTVHADPLVLVRCVAAIDRPH